MAVQQLLWYHGGVAIDDVDTGAIPAASRATPIARDGRLQTEGLKANDTLSREIEQAGGRENGIGCGQRMTLSMEIDTSGASLDLSDADEE